jgi:hypothetical protein
MIVSTMRKYKTKSDSLVLFVRYFEKCNIKTHENYFLVRFIYIDK